MISKATLKLKAVIPMNYKYGSFSAKQIHAEKEQLKKSIFILLPYKETEYELLDKYFDSLLFRISGLNELFMHQPEVITLMSLLEAARHETSFVKYRKAILDATALVDSIKECDADV